MPSATATRMQQDIEVMKNNEAATHSDMEKSNEDQQGNNENTFGSWMVVKKNYCNRDNSQNRINGDKGKKHIPTVDAQAISESQKATSNNGSRFAIFGMENECIEIEPTEQVQRESRELDDIMKLISIPQKGESILSTTKKNHNGKDKSTSNAQFYTVQNEKHAIMNDIMKSKSIVEKFIRTIGKERNNTLRPLKPIPSSSFKTQKSRDINKHRDKAKSLMLVTNLNNPLGAQVSSQGDMELFMLKYKPPDPVIANLRTCFREMHTDVEKSSKMTRGDNRDLAMEGHDETSF